MALAAEPKDSSAKAGRLLASAGLPQEALLFYEIQNLTLKTAPHLQSFAAQSSQPSGYGLQELVLVRRRVQLLVA